MTPPPDAVTPRSGEPVPEPLAASRRGFSRRRLLGLAGAGAVGMGIGVGGAAAAERAVEVPDGDERIVPFHGQHQAGIATAVQGHLHFAAYDVVTTDRGALVDLLQRWTTAAAAMCAGDQVGRGALGGPDVAPPDDTGEAVGLAPSRLTITIGFGPSLFDHRFGLADRRPAALVDLPHFAGDVLEQARCGGDLAIQACADDPQVAVHAIRNLTRIATGVAAVRWAQLGFGAASSTTKSSATPRNLFGFKDGTDNIATDETAELAQHVWAGGGETAREAWMQGGSYLVGRRILMTIETWDRTSRTEQEQVVGRSKGEGAPLGHVREHDAFRAASLPANSHVALAHPSAHGGVRMLRRGYNFVDGADGLGHLDAGLFFLAYQQDPRTAFIPVQRALASHDAMREYLRHTGSGVWACPPGTAAGGSWGEALFA